MIIEHASVTWENYIPKIVKTLVLGSFNPNHPNNNTDYFYGRSSNYFWKTIADILGKNEDYFCGNFERKIEVMEKYEFCFCDLIQEIKIEGGQEIVNQFISVKIFKEFTDQIIFTSKTTFNNNEIRIERKYNDKILDLIEDKNISKIIHTLGKSTIDKKLNTKWKEKKLKDKGLQGFIKKLNEACKIEKESFSPSGRAVKSGGKKYYSNLKNWIRTNLIIDL